MKRKIIKLDIAANQCNGQTGLKVTAKSLYSKSVMLNIIHDFNQTIV